MCNKTKQRQENEPQQPPKHQESWWFRAVRAVAGPLGNQLGKAVGWGVGGALSPHVQMAATGLIAHGQHLPHIPGLFS